MLLVHDQPSEGVAKANVWMIDFGKTTPLNGDKALDHRTPWVEGTYLENLLSIRYIFNKVNLTKLLISIIRNVNLILNLKSCFSSGNQEDGYLFGLDNLVNLFENLSNIPAPEGQC